MSCLLNYILLDGVAPVTPNSGLFLNRELTLPVAKVSSLANNEQQTLSGIWTEVQNKAIKKFVIRLKLGMQELFSRCNDVDDTWICANKEDLAMPFMYYLGSELMIEVIHTTRINRFTTIDRDRASEMKDEFDREFPIQLKAALQIINSKADVVKVQSGEVFDYVDAIP